MTLDQYKRPVPDETLEKSKPDLGTSKTLVDRLRAKDAGATTVDAELMAKAADEIERLQRERDAARASLAFHFEQMRASETPSACCEQTYENGKGEGFLEREELRAEVERLQNDVQELTCGDPRKVCPNCRSAETPASPCELSQQALHLAQVFHKEYEGFAQDFSYVTRPDTKKFDPESPNGRLMIRVCLELLSSGQIVLRGAEKTVERLTDAQCDVVIEFLEDYEWTGLTRDNVRTWDQAIRDAQNGK